MPESDIPPQILDFLRSIKAKRARIVIEHLLTHGYITTEELQRDYGYNHPPRAARDVREQGVPLETFTVQDSQGRSIAAYRFGDWSLITHGRIGGRVSFPKNLKETLAQQQGNRCAVCGTHYETRYLQIDHRIPYEIGGDTDSPTQFEHYMLLCASCNRAKSWSCEHCQNWVNNRTLEICATCYWASPTNYQHLAMQQEHRVTLVWRDLDSADYESLLQKAAHASQTIGDYLKHILKMHLSE